MDLPSVVYLGVLVSLVLSAILSLIILPPTRSVLRRLCPADDAVAFWTRFTVLMLFLGPLIVTLIFGVPYSDFSSRLSATDLVVRVVSAALVGAFLTLGGIGLRIGTLRPAVVFTSPAKKTDDEFIR
jgi:ABC-type transport system involved in cytochrome c biogenesis permease subunit